MMLSLLEFINPKAPEKIVNSSDIPGEKIITFKTKKGNRVSVTIETQYDNGEANIQFTVNGSMKDDSSKTKDSNTDFDILSGVLHVVGQFLNDTDVNEVIFVAYTSDKDLKTLNNLPYDKEVEDLTNKSKQFHNIITGQSGINVSTRDKRLIDELISEVSDFTKTLKSVKREEVDVLTILQTITSFKSRLLNIPSFDIKYTDEFSAVYNAFVALSEKITSYRPSGVKVRMNRREHIYEKMLQKYLPSNWKYINNGGAFKLTRTS